MGSTLAATPATSKKAAVNPIENLFVRINSLLIVLLMALSLVAGCASQRPTSSPPVVVTPQKLAGDLNTLRTLTPQLQDLDARFHTFNLQGGWRERGYFNAEEADRVEGLLFRFVTSHTALWDMADSYGGPEAIFTTDDAGARAELLFMTAAMLLTSHTAGLVVEFAGDPIAIKEINQAFYRSEIPFGTYDKMRENVTNPDKLRVITELKAHYVAQSEASDSPFSRLAANEPAYAAIISAMPTLLDQAESRLNSVARAYPSHSESKRTAREDSYAQHKELYKVRSVVFKDVSRLKSPGAHLIRFSPAQKQQVYDSLKPGDLVLTYTAGYMSSVFIPGAFKHGITFIGTPDQREDQALSAEDLPAADQYDLQVLAQNLDKTMLPDAKEADMIEAVAEGVIFNNLGHIMDTHINRMLVLRPRLTDAQLDLFLLQVFTYLGEGYDFRFDFADTTYQVCTEVIYRALDGKGGIEFELTERAGHVTLSADDVVNYHLAADPPRFDFVLYAEEDPAATNHDARVMVGDAGARRLQELMQQAAR